MDKECPICFDEFDEFESSKPTSCAHIFHLACIKRWSRTTSTCPTCRQEISSIETTLKRKDGTVRTRIEPVEKAESREEATDSMNNINWTCHICFIEEPGDDAYTLICEGCEFGFHIGCLNPPLQSVPEGDWFCAQCVRLRDNIEPSSDQCTYCCSPRNLTQGHQCCNCARRFHSSCVPQLVQQQMQNRDEWLCNYCFYLHDNEVFEALRRPPQQRRAETSARSNTVRARRRIDRRNEFIELESQVERNMFNAVIGAMNGGAVERPASSRSTRRSPFGMLDDVVLDDADILDDELPPVRRRTRGPKVKRTRKVKRPSPRKKFRKRRGRVSKRTREVDREESPVAKDKNTIPIQSSRLGITSGYADIGDLDDNYHGEGTSGIPPVSTTPPTDLLANILEEQEKVLAPGNLFDQRGGKFVAKEKEFEDYRKTVQTKKAPPKSRPWPSSSSRITKPDVPSRPSFTYTPRRTTYEASRQDPETCPKNNKNVFKMSLSAITPCSNVSNVHTNFKREKGSSASERVLVNQLQIGGQGSSSANERCLVRSKHVNEESVPAKFKPTDTLSLAMVRDTPKMRSSSKSVDRRSQSKDNEVVLERDMKKKSTSRESTKEDVEMIRKFYYLSKVIKSEVVEKSGSNKEQQKLMAMRQKEVIGCAIQQGGSSRSAGESSESINTSSKVLERERDSRKKLTTHGSRNEDVRMNCESIYLPKTVKSEIVEMSSSKKEHQKLIANKADEKTKHSKKCKEGGIDDTVQQGFDLAKVKKEHPVASSPTMDNVASSSNTSIKQEPMDTSISTSGTTEKGSTKRKSDQDGAPAMKKAKADRLDVKEIDNIAKSIFDNAYLKRLIDRISYKSGLREVVKMSYKLRETKEQIKTRACDYIEKASDKK